MRNLPPNVHEHQTGDIKEPPLVVRMPAESIQQYIRTGQGFEIVHPFRTLTLALIPAFFGFLLTLFYLPGQDGQAWFFGFLALGFFISCLTFIRRAIGQRRGENLHTKDGGYSILTRRLGFLPVPVTEQILTPLAISSVGWLMARVPIAYVQGRPVVFSFLLGWWLVAGGFSYFLLASWERRARLAHMREVGNQTIRADLFSSRLDQREQAQARYHAKKRQAGPQATTGEGGMEPDIAELGSGS